MLFLEIGLVCLIFTFGILGSFFPILPGPIITLIGFVYLHLGTRFSLERPLISVLVVLFFALIVTFSDFFLQIFGIQKMGGSKNAIWGVSIGFLVSIFFSFTFISLLLGPIIGGFIGSLIDLKIEFKKSKSKTLLKSLSTAFGSFLGFFLGTLIKFLFSFIIFLIAIFHIFNHSNF